MSLIQQNAYRSIKMLQDISRFTVINLNNTDYVFDGYTYMYFLLPPVIQKLMSSGNDQDILNTLHEMKENDLKCFCLFSARSINTEFEKPVLKTNKTTRCDVLLNLGTECDLDCAYCYRDKNAHKRTDIETATATVKFAQHVYKPHAEGYSVSFDISSEPLMERQEMQSFVNSYTELEQYWFQKDEFLDGTAIDFYMMLPETVRGLNDFPKTDDEAVKLINKLLLRKDLLGLLEIQKLKETQQYINKEYERVETMPNWKLVRLNHWGLEALFPKIIKHRQSPYVSFWYMSNGTLLNEHDIALIKGCCISPFVISIDGPEWVHNKLRPEKFL